MLWKFCHVCKLTALHDRYLVPTNIIFISFELGAECGCLAFNWCRKFSVKERRCSITSLNSRFEIVPTDTTSILSRFNTSTRVSAVFLPTLYGPSALLVPAYENQFLFLHFISITKWFGVGRAGRSPPLITTITEGKKLLTSLKKINSEDSLDYLKKDFISITKRNLLSTTCTSLHMSCFWRPPEIRILTNIPTTLSWKVWKNLQGDPPSSFYAGRSSYCCVCQ